MTERSTVDRRGLDVADGGYQHQSAQAHVATRVVVIGGGPAGMAAARAARLGAATVTLVDEAPALGGQIWGGELGTVTDADGVGRIAELIDLGVEHLPGHRVADRPVDGQLLVESDRDARLLGYDRLILACGARELFLPFPGWTLPGVVGAAGLLNLVKGGVPVTGDRIVVAGSGPLLLIVAAHLASHGARIVAFAEQSPLRRQLLMLPALLRSPGKLAQAIRLLASSPATERLHGWWPLSVVGHQAELEVHLGDGRLRRSFRCDWLACGFGLVPNLELAQLLGCATAEKGVIVDEAQQCSQPGVFAAGELTGIGGVDEAVVEGEIAGWSAAGRPDEAARLAASRRRHHRFSSSLDRAFALDPRLARLAHDDTLVCRCEDIPVARLEGYASWREAKLHTRCGMGPCQGRICGPAARHLFGWDPGGVRPPSYPSRLGSLALLSADGGVGQPGSGDSNPAFKRGN